MAHTRVASRAGEPRKPKKSKIINKKVPASLLRVHPICQKKFIPAVFKRILSALDLDAIGVVHVVEYTIDGVKALWIVDGQHRWRALMEEGLGDWMVDIQIHADVQDDAAASALFLRLGDRGVIASYDKFLNEVVAGDPVARGVVSMVEKHGFKIHRAASDGAVMCVEALKQVFRKDDGATLSATLDVIVAAWGHKVAGTEGTIIAGLGLFLARYNGEVDVPVLIKKLAKYEGGPSGLLGSAKGLRSVRGGRIIQCVESVVRAAYNKGRRMGQLGPSEAA